MKKILILVSIFALTISLSACGLLNGEDPSAIVCDEGYTLNNEGTCVLEEEPPTTIVCAEGETNVDGSCVTDEPVELTCPIGQSDVDGECAADALVCQTDYHEDEGACVPNEGTELYRTNVLETLLAQMTANPVYLGVVLQDMTFEQGMEIMYEVDIEVTKDVDVVDTLSIVITDTMIENMLQREMSLVMNETTFDFSIYYETVEEGVKVYIQPGMFIEMIAATDPVTAERLEWAGFDSEWAVFEFGETLDSMIQMDVLSEMLSTLFFNEKGAAYFYDLQQQFEDELSVDLNEYGIDLGLLVDDVLAGNYDVAKLAIENIDSEALMLHIDYLYVAPELFAVIEEYEIELIAGGFRYTELAPLLNTAHWVTDSVTGIESVVLDVELDGTKGTEAFIDALNETDKDALVEVLRTKIQSTTFEDFQMEMKLDSDVHENIFNMFVDNETAFVALFDQTRFDAIRDMFGVTSEEEYDFTDLWNMLTPEELEWLESLVDPIGYEWYTNTLDAIAEYELRTNDVVNFLTLHKTELDALGYMTQDHIDQINTEGLDMWLESIDMTLFTPLLDAYLYTFLDDLEIAYEAGTGLDFVFETVFSNSHTQSLLNLYGLNPWFDNDAMIVNMVAIDWNQIVLEEIDYEELAMAIQEGTAAFDAFLIANETTAPNTVMFLEVFAPAVESLQPFMVYVDDMTYAMEGLDVFDELINPSFYLDYIVDIEMTATDDITLVVDVEIDGLGYATLFDEIIDNMNVYMSGFTMVPFPYDENWECIDEDDTTCENPNMTLVKQVLLGLDSTFITLEFDPSNMTWTTIDVDMTDLLDGVAKASYEQYVANMLLIDSTWEIANGDEQVTGFNVASISISMKEVTTLDSPDPLETTSVNEIVEDFGKFLVSAEGYGVLQDIFEIYSVGDDFSAMIELFNTPTYLGDIEGLYVNEAFDATISYFVITGNILSPSSLGFELELFWVDGEEVFTEPLGLNDLLPLFQEDEIISELAYDILVGLPDDETYGLSRVLLLLAMSEDYNEMEEMPELN